MPYRLAEEADSNVAELYRYGTIEFGEIAADNYLSALHDIFDLIGRFPRIGRDIGDGYRAYTFRVHILFYVVHPDDTVEIMRVMSARSNWREHLG